VSNRELYTLTCHGCGHVIELSAIDGQAKCPNCQASLTVDWHGARREFEKAVRA
jgi:hypothetical protein